MPVSSPDLNVAEARLRECLEQHFPTSAASIVREGGAPHPLLLLRMPSGLAAFALANGDPRRCFTDTYAFFKKLYTARHAEWDQLNLSFVLCLARRDRELDAFCAQVETDVFFCRKFTVALDVPLDDELARLPFFPLQRGPSGFQRPPSAQTLLQSCGVPPMLARYLVQPSERSAERILDDCLGAKFGEPELTAATATAALPQVESEQVTRMESLTVQNFRAYRRKETFDLSADLIVLYGPNGFGKTSFFDAVDFVATGGIGRLALRNDTPRFVKAAKHLDTGSKASAVTLSVRSGGAVREIIRMVDDRNEPTVDRHKTNRKTALAVLTGTLPSTGADRIDNMVQLFRAAHLFNQERQTLTEDLRDHCRLSTDLVSRMLAFEDFVTAGKKVAKILELLRARTRERTARAKEFADSLFQHRAELKRLQQSMQASATPQVVTVMREELRREIIAAGLNIEGEADNSSVEARGWRALIEAGLSGVADSRQRLAALVANTALIIEKRRELDAALHARPHSRQQASQIEQSLRDQQNGIGAIEALISNHAEREKALDRRMQALKWHRENKPAYDSMVSGAATLNNEILALTVQLTKRNELQVKLGVAVGTAEAQRNQARQQLEAHKKLTVQFEKAAAQRAELQQLLKKRAELEEILARTKVQLSALQTELEARGIELQETAHQEQRLVGEVARIENQQGELQNLLASLEAHVTGETCPACGTKHGSKEELINQLRQRRATGTVSNETLELLNNIRERRATLSARVDELKALSRRVQQQLVATSAELSRIPTAINELETELQRLGLEPDDENFVAQLQLHQHSAKQREWDLAQVVFDRQRAEETTRTEFSSARYQVESLQRELGMKKEALTGLLRQLAELRPQASQREISLDLSAAEIVSSEAVVEREISNLREQLARTRGELNTARASATQSANRLETVKQELRALDTKIASLRQEIGNYEMGLGVLNLPTATTKQQLETTERVQRDRAASLEQLEQKVTAYERALDAAATSVAAAELTSRIRSIETEATVVETVQTKDKAWSGYFQKIEDTLRETQDRAVKGYTQKYGPLASLFQRRLRPVSGFDRVLLQPEGSNIDVHVERNGERLPPVDFFSQSQQQILMLSLFLTACTTQTWSLFAPILLDDPVTHFDDLNAYSFLDLIAGLISSEPGRRQFVISTCEERLFQLVRQKFDSMGSRVKLYQFVSLGKDGPVIERIGS